MALCRHNFLCVLLLCYLQKNQVESFVLEGSPRSYASFRRWVCHDECSLSFQFQTLKSNGLLLYMEEGYAFDFIELKLVEGVLRLHFIINDDRKVIVMGEYLHDGQWHRVEIIYNKEEAFIRLDNNTIDQVSHEAKHTLSDNIAANFLYIGGIPGRYKRNPNLLGLPSVAFEPTFEGGIKHLLYSSDDGPATKQNIIDSHGVRTNQLDACKHQNPCQNGGACISTDVGSTCDCRRVDYEGTYCEKAKSLPEMTFRGGDYLYYQKTLTQAIVSSREEISLYFKSRQHRGILIYSGYKDDYISVSVRDGGIVLTLKFGSKLEEKSINPAGVGFNDNQWHRVLIYRKVRKFSLTVDGIHTVQGSVVGTFSLLLSNVLYVGGVNPSSDQVKTRGESNFVGCLCMVLFTADSITLDVLALARSRNKFIHHHGDPHFLCHEVEAEDPITFTDEESSLVLPCWNTPKSGNISFKFRTNEPNGVLVFNRGVPHYPDVFAFELFEGHIFLLLNLGSGSIKIKATASRVDNEQWHYVMLTRRGKTGRVTVDKSVVEFTTPGFSKHLDLDGPLIIGGINTFDNKTSIPIELWSGILKYGYVGCFRDLVINGESVDIASFAQKQESSGIRLFCHVSSKHCDSRPCFNGGKCSEGWNRFFCDCSFTSFSGTVCAKDAATLTFNDGQFFKIAIPEGVHTQTEDVTLRFKTKRPNSLMLGTNSQFRSSQMLITLELGQVKFMLSVIGSSEVFYVGQGLNDDKWHTLKIKRRGKNLLAQLDMEYSQKTFTSEMILDLNSIYLGAKPSGKDSTAPLDLVKEVPNFVGQMQHFVFNGVSFFDMARSEQIPNSIVTAKFGKSGNAVYHAVTFISKFTFIALPQLEAYSSLTLHFQFKTLEPNGLLLYNGGKDQDYIALELVDGRLHYVFNAGNGQRRLKSNMQTNLNNYQWHAVTVGRPSPREHTLMVDGAFATLTDIGFNVHLDLNGLLYVGGVRSEMYATVSDKIESNHGFKGCMSSLDLNGEVIDLSKYSLIPSTLVSSGCTGEERKCSDTACANEGVCLQMWNSYTCDCDMTSFTGPTCSEESIAYLFGPKGGIIQFQYPFEERPNTKTDFLALGFMTVTSDAVLVRIDSGSSNDYMELQIMDGSVHFMYNLGSIDHCANEHSVSINDGHYHVVRITRLGSNSTIQVDDHNIQAIYPDEKHLTTFNSLSAIQVGGQKDDFANKINGIFEGVIAGLVFNGQRILDIAAKKDPRVMIEGQVERLASIPLSLHQTTTQKGKGISEKGNDIIHKSDCLDDKDTCFNKITEEITTGPPVSSAAQYEESRDERKQCHDNFKSKSPTKESEQKDLVQHSENNKPTLLPSSLAGNETTDLFFPKHATVLYMPGKRNVRYQVTHKSKSSANKTILVIGIVAGTVVITIMIALMTYRLAEQREMYISENENCQCTTSLVSIDDGLKGGSKEYDNEEMELEERSTTNSNTKDPSEWYV